MFQESYMRKIVALVGVMAVLALLAYTYSTIKQTKYMYSGPTTVSVTGVGEVFATPDIATFSFTIEAKELDAVAAQNKSGETMNAVLAYLKETGVEEKDIKTEYYNLTPQYEYPQTICTQWSCPPAGEPKLIGYQVSQSVSVKVRDTAKAGELVSGVGSKGAMNVSGLSFTIDDEEKLMAEAREKAIVNAKEQAEALAKNLDARIVRMNGYWEEQGGYPTPYGIGGGMDMMKAESDAMSRPAELPTGENTITARVNISYEIK
jgi:uncharacterized protein YggE